MEQRTADLTSFRRFLRSKGKKEHVADDLCRRVSSFESFLGGRGKSLEAAQETDIREYPGAGDGGRNNDLRALALYFRFCGRAELAGIAGGLRETAIAAGRQPFPVRQFLGVDPAHMELLAAEGIVNVDQMIAAGATPAARRDLAARTGIPPSAIDEYVKLSDISRVGAIKTKRARLYVDAGLDTIDKIAALTAEQLVSTVKEYIRKTGFDGVPTLPKEAANAVATARKIERLVKWE